MAKIRREPGDLGATGEPAARHGNDREGELLGSSARRASTPARPASESDRPSNAPQADTRRSPSAWAQYRALLAKDIRQELRTREMLTSMAVYALLVLTIYGAALAQVGDQLQVVKFASGLLWALIVFTSLLGLNRSFAHETETGCLEGILLAPVDRAVIFLAKATSNLLFLLAVEVITVPMFFLFFLSGAELSGAAPLMALPLVVGTVGVAGVGTLLSTMAVGTRGRDVMLAILFIPVAFPLLYACVSATGAVLVGVQDMMTVFWRGVALAAAYDVVMIAAAWGLYEFALDA
ncbi:MAG: heme exporter protein CcmB [Coriobacteriaceae bacterium]|nr:heme exporter protein CcmB [Coriobacteriaceae bacterium]